MRSTGSGTSIDAKYIGMSHKRLREHKIFLLEKNKTIGTIYHVLFGNPEEILRQINGLEESENANQSF